jgi:hypothetical protein
MLEQAGFGDIRLTQEVSLPGDWRSSPSDERVVLEAKV